MRTCWSYLAETNSRERFRFLSWLARTKSVQNCMYQVLTLMPPVLIVENNLVKILIADSPPTDS